MLTLALVMTVVMGGILAYTGDLIGRRFGKKRVTMFGLRPRYTAILITSVTGVMISGITTGVLFLLVPPVRDVILRGEQAIASNKLFRAQNRELGERNAVLSAQTDSLSRQISETKAELSSLSAERKTLQGQVDATQRRLTAAQSRLTQTVARLATVEREFASTRARNATLLARNRQLGSRNTLLADINQSLATTNGKLTEQNGQLTKDNAVLIAQKGQLDLAYEEGSKRNVELTRQNTELERQTRDLERQRTVLSRVVDQLRTTTDEQKQKNDRLEIENERLAKINSSLASDNLRLKGMIPGYASLVDAYQAARSRRVVVHKDEDLARVVVPAGLDPAGVRTYVDALIRDASDAAKLRGASSSDSLRAVQVVDRQFLEQLPTGELHTVEITGNDRIDAVVSKLAWQTTPSAVLAIAVTNSVEQEPAGIDLQPLPNRLVYQKGQQVFWRYVNATQSSTGIYVDVVNFLKDMGRSALERGVIPRMDPLTGEPEIGAMSGGEIMDLVEKIKSTGGRARVKAVAQFDTYSADPLKLKFEVTP